MMLVKFINIVESYDIEGERELLLGIWRFKVQSKVMKTYLIRPVVTFVANAHKSTWTYVRIADDTFPVAFFAQATDSNSWLLPAHDQIRMMLRHNAAPIYSAPQNYYTELIAQAEWNWRAKIYIGRKNTDDQLSSDYNEAKLTLSEQMRTRPE